jgi:microcystin-dependent protein
VNNSAPTNATGSGSQGTFLLCNGAAISRSTYSTLFGRIGTSYGAGNGSSTFNIPDLRSEFIRCRNPFSSSPGVILKPSVATHNHGGGTGNVSTDHTHSGNTGNVSTDHVHWYNRANSSNVPGDGDEGGPRNANRGEFGSNTGGFNSNHVHGANTNGINANHSHSILNNGVTNIFDVYPSHHGVFYYIRVL